MKSNPSLLGTIKGNPSLLGSLKRRTPAAAFPIGTAEAAAAWAATGLPSPAQGRPTPPTSSSMAGGASPQKPPAANGIADDAGRSTAGLENGGHAQAAEQAESRPRKKREWGPSLEEAQPLVSGRQTVFAPCARSMPSAWGLRSPDVCPLVHGLCR